MKKNELRKIMKYTRRNIIDRDLQNNYVYNYIINNVNVNKDTTILIYVSFNDEVDTIKLINYFLNKCMVAVPRIDNDIMNFYYISSFNDLKNGYFNILEPINNDLVSDFSNCVCIVPGICFDKNNYRIGYGKGYYDKFLHDKDIYTIGLSFRECIVDIIEHDDCDIPLKKVIYPK